MCEGGDCVKVGGWGLGEKGESCALRLCKHFDHKPLLHNHMLHT